MKKEQETVNWTQEQRDAIFSRGEDLAVSAAAGSGKTKVLVQRIVELLSENKVLASRIAVVTYTKAAAAELEERLYSTLSKKAGEDLGNERLQKQLFSLSRAHISTIHSFALTLIKEHRKELGLGEKLRVGSDAECALLEACAIREAMNAFLAEAPPEEKAIRESLFYLLGDHRGFQGVINTVQRLLKSASSCPGGLLYFKEKVNQLKQDAEKMRLGEMDFFSTPMGKVILGESVKCLEEGAGMLFSMAASLENTQFLSSVYTPEFIARAEALTHAALLAKKGDLFGAGHMVELLFSKSLPNTKGCPQEELDLKEDYSKLHNEKVKTPLKKYMAEMAALSAPRILKEVTETVSLTEQLFLLAQTALDLFDCAKREKGILDYADLEQMALKLVAEYRDGTWHKTPLAHRIGRDFDAIFVDEYQDTNKTQDLIFRMIAREGTLFLVGDPKQSIYQFRGAEPSIFSEYKNSLPFYGEEKKGMKKILLSNNFRCDAPVIDTVNRIFSVMMDDSLPDSLYGEKDRLVFSKKIEPWENAFPAELVFVSPNGEEMPREEEIEEVFVSEEDDPEAAYIAGRINSILEGEITKENGALFRPSDIAVLCRYGTHLAGIRKTLRRYGIPYCTGQGEPLKEEPEYLFVTSLLATLDNPTKDIPLLGTLSSPVFRFSPDALYRIRKIADGVSYFAAMKEYAARGEHAETKEKCGEALEVLDLLRGEGKKLSLTAFIYSVYRRFAIDLLFCSQAQKGAVRAYFLEAAKKAEGAEVSSLGEFCRFLEQDKTDDLSSGADGVNLMTVHKSKGLEFPIVFVSYLSGKFNSDDEKPALLINRTLGIASGLPKLEGTARLDTLMRKALKIQMHKEAIDEEKRVLYVALTRARNKLILTSDSKKLKGLRKALMLRNTGEMDRALVRSRMEHAHCPLEILVYAMRSLTAFRCAMENGKDSRDSSLIVRFATPSPTYFARREEEKGQEDFDPQSVLRYLDFKYKDPSLETLPQKLSVSRILRSGHREGNQELFPRRLLDFEKGTLKSGAEKIGTATHQVMQFCDFDAMEKDPEGEFCRLVEKGFLSPEDMVLVEKGKLLSFFSSPLYRRMKASPNLVREKRFNVLLDAASLGVGTGRVLVQGVVDAWFENPDGSLTVLDFKTDRVKEEDGEAVLRERHGDQLRLYAQAVEEMTGKTVSALYLYSFALKREVPVDR